MTKMSEVVLEFEHLLDGWTMERHAASDPTRLNLPIDRRQKGRKVAPGTSAHPTPPVLNGLERDLVLRARASVPMEACGALLLRDGEIHVAQFPNQARALSQFRIPDRDVIALHKLDRDHPGSVYAIWHSHPNGQRIPSIRDCEVHPRIAKHMVLVLPKTAEVVYYSPESAVAQQAHATA